MNEQLELFHQLHKDNTLNEIQAYIKQVIDIRGFSTQPIEQTLLMLTEEVGELAKAIRKHATNMNVDSNKEYKISIEEEVADIFIVLTSICNRLDINMEEGILNKEKINIQRTWKNGQ